MSYTERFNRIPPRLCRLLARTHNGLRLMTQEIICTRSGLSRERVVQISNLDSWAGVQLEVIERFTAACGVDLLDDRGIKEHLRFLRRRKRAYLANATPMQRRMLAKLMAGLTPERDQ